MSRANVIDSGLEGYSSLEGMTPSKIRYPRSLSDVAYAKMRYGILEGVFGSGAHLVERDLCKSLEIGRTPIREALMRLEADGLLERVPGAGFYVRHLTMEDIQEAYEIRTSLECLAIRIACRKGFCDTKLDEMERLCGLFACAVQKKDTNEIALTDYHFHQKIIGLAESPRLEAAVRSSHLQFFTWSRSLGMGAYLKKSGAVGEQHHLIIEQLRKRNVREAERLLKEHIEGSFRRRIEETQGPSKQKSMFRDLRVVGDLAWGVKASC